MFDVGRVEECGPTFSSNSLTHSFACLLPIHLFVCFLFFCQVDTVRLGSVTMLERT